MDTDAGANPFGHASLIFSQQETETSPIKVLNGIGFYSQPSSTTNPFVAGVKKLISLNVDLQDGHGVLENEDMRYLDGDGLHGLSFEINQEQFNALRNNYQQMMKTEREVIEELNAELMSQGIEPNGHTRYVAEKAKAAAEGRIPRLKPFHITMKLTMSGFDSSDSYTCKDYALELLSQHKIIPTTVKDQLISNKATTAFPVFSSLYLPPIRLISTGAPGEIITSKTTGQVFYNHVWEKNSLYWATPIHTPEEQISGEDANYFQLKNLFNRIREKENALRQKISAIENKPEPDQEHLRKFNVQLQRVQNLVFLFNNSYENQIAELFTDRLSIADKVLETATQHLNEDEANYSFLLKAYNGVSLYDSIVGLLAIAITTTISILITPVAFGLVAINSLYAAHQFFERYNKAETNPAVLNDKVEQYLLEGPEPEGSIAHTLS